MQRTFNLALRPRSFDQMIGNESNVAAIKNRLQNGVVPVAFLFVGPYGTGKTTLARIIAREVQGFDFPEDIEPEVVEINAADITGIDAMRGLVSTTVFRPMVGRYKIIILDEAHRLSQQTQDLLLKEWERENSTTVWIVCTTESGKIRKGLQDRAFKLEIKPMTSGDREKLVARAAATLNEPQDYSGGEWAVNGRKEFVKPFLAAAAEAGLNSPRDILMSFERFVSGIPANEAVRVEQSEPKYFEVVKAACFGNWPECAKQLAALNEQLSKEKRSEDSEKADAEHEESKAAAAIAIKGIAGGFLRSMLLGKEKGPATGNRAKNICAALKALRNSSPLLQQDAALAFPMVCEALYEVAVLMANKE